MATATAVLLLFLVLLLLGAAPARGLSGTAACPEGADNSAAWCQTWFGGAGGTVTARPWGTNTFACVCNGAASLVITRTMDTTTTSSTQPPVHNSSGSSSSSSSSSSSMSSSSHSHAANYTCSWSGVFTDYPDGVQCLPSTGICPSSCSQMPTYVCDAQQAYNCYTNGASSLYYQCLTCRGQLFTIQTTAPNVCRRDYTTTTTCDPVADCSGHGCCNNAHFSGNNATTGGAVCSCYYNSSVGFYAGARCRDCASGYAPNSENVCKRPQQPVQVVLASIAKTWTMVSPNMAVLFLFVIFSLVRKLNTSDEPSELTGLRRANLSTVQVARRRQQSLFHSKYVPKRPAQSRSFANTQQPRTRGPSAY